MGSSYHRTTLAGGPKLELADIFTSYQQMLGPLSPAQAKVVQDILNCRTHVLGGHVRRCDGCGEEEISYNSCRNRHCPKCQFLARARWVEARSNELLPIPYFHVVFTLPHELNPLILCNKRPLYDLLFRAASETLKEVGARRLQGAQMGFTAVLHTWGQNLMDHPHLHMIVPGGALSADGKRWISTPANFLLPLRVLSEVYRGKFLSALERMRGDLSYPESIQDLKAPGRFKNLLIRCAEKSWVVYAKRPFAGPKQVINYLGNYTHRVAISNFRLIKLEDDHVHFHYRDYKTNESKIKVLHAREFMRRFLLHVLPPKYVRMRHFGFMGSRFKQENLESCRAILTPKQTGPQAPGDATDELTNQPLADDWKRWLKEKTGIDINRCKTCREGEMRDVRLIPLQLHKRGREHPPPKKGFDTS